MWVTFYLFVAWCAVVSVIVLLILLWPVWSVLHAESSQLTFLIGQIKHSHLSRHMRQSLSLTYHEVNAEKGSWSS